MSRLDIVIFGATGFTGKYVVAEMIKMVKEYPGLTWGVAGRSKDKLQALMSELAEKTGEDLTKVVVIVADCGDPKSLKSMCERTKVLVNCCGPYRFLGAPVVQAAIQGEAHYVDVCGEPQFMEQMQLDYDAQARYAGVYVISSCGFDSIPADMGVIYLQKKFEGTLNSVKAYFSAEVPSELRDQVKRQGVIHYTTWESLIHGLRHRGELAALRKQLYPVPLPVFKPTLGLRPLVHRLEGGHGGQGGQGGQWCAPLPTADAGVVRRTQRRAHELHAARPAHFRAFVRLPARAAALLLCLAALVGALTMFDVTTRLLLRYPRLFSAYMVSHEGPTEEVAENTRFTLELRGEGWARDDDLNSAPTKRVTAKVTGTNPGYGTTAVAVLLSAITILKEQNLMPTSGGVMTTGTAFRNTHLIENLNKHNVKFEIIDKTL